MKIAIIGSGISGLTCAHHLSKHHEVDVYESNNYVGGHTNTVEVTVDSGPYKIDTGFIVFNDWTYPNFIKLLTDLSVPINDSVMSFSVKSERSQLEYNGTTLNTLFAQRMNLFKPQFHKMIRDILRFNRESEKVLSKDSNEKHLTLKEYLKNNNYSLAFKNHYIIPMGAAIWSSSTKQMEEFPIEYFVRFFKNHGMLSVNHRPTWKVIKGGSSAYIPYLIKNFKDRIHLNTEVMDVLRVEDGVQLTIRKNGETKIINADEVIFACHSVDANRILKNKMDFENEILGSFEYQENRTTLHTDHRVLPKKKRAWAAWNYLIPKETRHKVAVSYNMNILQSIDSKETFIVSLNMDGEIDETKVLKKIKYEHPVYSEKSINAQKRWSEISGVNRVHFCGAYWGFGFHEDGVKSALSVVNKILPESKKIHVL